MNPPPPSSRRRELGLIVLVILKAQHLQDPHKFSKQDPFCIARLGEDGEEVRTIVDKNGGQVPLWDEEFRLKLYQDLDSEVEGQVLNLRIMRKEGRDEELIGEGNVRIDGKSWREFDEWIELKKDGKYAGEVYCEMTFYPLEVQQRHPSNDLRRHPSKLDPTTRLPPSLLPGGLSQSFSHLSVTDSISRHSLNSNASTTILHNPQYQPGSRSSQDSQDLLPFPGEPERVLPNPLRPGSALPPTHPAHQNSHESLPLPGQQWPPRTPLQQHPSAEHQQSLRPSSAVPMQSHQNPEPFNQNSSQFSSSPSQYNLSPLQQQYNTQSASYPTPATYPSPSPQPLSHTPQPKPASYPPPLTSHQSLAPPSPHHAYSAPPVPPRPSSAASSITEVMPGSFHPPRSPSPILPPRNLSPSPSPSRAPSTRPPLPMNPVGSSSFSPAMDAKRREAESGRSSSEEMYRPPPPAYPASGSSSSRDVEMAQQREREQEREREREKERERERKREREDREIRERQRREQEEFARKERERISEEAKMNRIREAQERQAARIKQELEDQRLAEEYMRNLQEEEKVEREARERADEEMARRFREEEDEERKRREREDEEFVRKLREDERRAEDLERARRLVEDERLARSLAERENDEEESRRANAANREELSASRSRER
ncbi:hypothetical protein JCM5353_004400 [Sporobolomyces roseus]